MKILHVPLSAVVLAALAACGGSDDPAPTPSDPGPGLSAAQSCSDLNGRMIARSEIGKPTSGAVVQSATLVKADAEGNANGEYCAVRGIVMPVDPAAPNLEFQVNLPTAWNKRALQLGGGAFNGSLVTGLGKYPLQPADSKAPLAQGYVTLGSDGGHKSSAGFDASFALNAESLMNFGQLSIKKTHDVAMALIKVRYGAAPERFYFIGASQGGHEALDAAARYPGDYDGVVSNYPAYNVTMLHLGSLNAGRAMYGNGGANWMNAAKVKLLTDAVYAACDPLDGVKDGVISNVAGCDAAFGIAGVRATLRCAGGGDTGDTCLSDAQIAGVETIASPYKPGVEIAGMTQFERWPILEGALFNVSSYGTVPQPANPLSGKEALLYSVGAATTKYIITRDVNFDPMTLDPKTYETRIKEVGGIMDVSDIDLAPFIAKGGKLIMIHGTADDFITPHNSIVYWNKLVAGKGQSTVDGFARFYVVPGLGHGFGPFNATYDALGALTGWVEQGTAPGVLTAIDANPGAARTRPMCRFPGWPKYKGEGPVGDAASFACVTE
ncbi:tannase/feruloyl esterase family alpha/beta hydrolase [Pigmentiphaga kullae]|uniref:Feruloyl esterase n=1 Tax=Pigmentiphaga kullae TaxID=151784 RepID=A0A4Q7NAE2_9BURK|nr:tannase/feruloyl esterase family alpha/beta hydrolase [Pigmentiphaga kullae]RZS78871.1 feruloyl esterase [Pigmentiphaga kullae]